MRQELDRSRQSVFFCRTLTRSSGQKDDKEIYYDDYDDDEENDDTDDEDDDDEDNIQVDHSTGPAGRTALHLAAGQGWSQVSSSLLFS